MTKIFKLAQTFEQKIAIANSNIYDKLVTIHDKAVGAEADPYSELPESVKSTGKTLVMAAAALADQVWRNGISADELRAKLEKLKSHTGMMANALSAYNDEHRMALLADIVGLVNSIVPVDIPALKKPATAPKQNADNPEGAGMALEQKPELDDEFKAVVESLAPKSYDPTYVADWDALDR